MSTRIAEQRRSQRRKTPSASVTVVLEQKDGPAAPMCATLVDISSGGICIELPKPVPVGAWVAISDSAPNGEHPLPPRARVAWCSAYGGRYQAGLAFHLTTGQDNTHAPAADYYDLLQVSTKAEPETIHRVYRLLAQRYHPDNAETGNEQVFRQLSEAYRVLSDPERRAAYDVHHRDVRQARWRIFSQADATLGMKAEKQKRLAILTMLYAKRLNDPGAPVVTLHEMEDLLGCPREHLEFSLWFLKERGWIARSDNGRYSITAAGIERAEEQESAWLPNDRLLPESSR